MCPTFRALRTEAAAPRNQANLLRQVASGAVDPRLWGSEELKANADLCIHCMACRTECPAGIDISSMMIEAKAAFVEEHGLAPADWFLSRVDLWSKLASGFPILWNALLKGGPTRWLIERTFGLSRHRSLPRAHRTPFLRRAERLGLTKARPQAPGPRVAYFVDVFANHFDQELAESVVGVLRQAGVNVHVPKRQRGSGMAALVAGDLDHARDLAQANLRALGDSVRDGYTVVCSEPTAALMLRHEYLKLTDDLDAKLVAENTMDVGQYLAGLSEPGPAAGPQACPPGPGRLPPALPPPGPGSRHPGPRPDPDDSRARRRVHRPRLLGDGRHLRHGHRELPDIAAGWSRPAQPPPGRRDRARLDRVRHVPDADGARGYQADLASGQTAQLELRPQPIAAPPLS